MGSITPTVNGSRGHIRLEVDWTSRPDAVECRVYRVYAGAELEIRDSPARLSNGLAILYDVEAPLDKPITYRTSVSLIVNGSFEDGVDEWDNAQINGTVEQSLTRFAPGQDSHASLLLSRDGGTGATRSASSERWTAAVGTSYTVSGWLMTPTDWPGGIGIRIGWYTAADALISHTGTADDLWPIAGEWGYYTLTGTAPATTAFARVEVVIDGTPPVGQVLYADEIYATTADASATSAMVNFPSGGDAGWWKDPLHPATMLRLQVDLDGAGCGAEAPGLAWLGSGDRARPADSSGLEVPDARYPIAVFAKRKSVRSSIRIGSRSFVDQDSLSALHDASSPLLLQLPAHYGEPEVYQLCAELGSGRLTGDMTVQWGIHATSYVEVEAPIGPADGVLGVRYQDLNRYTTYAQATAAGLTWQQVLRGQGSLL